MLQGLPHLFLAPAASLTTIQSLFWLNTYRKQASPSSSKRPPIGSLSGSDLSLGIWRDKMVPALMVLTVYSWAGRADKHSIKPKGRRGI